MAGEQIDVRVETTGAGWSAEVGVTSADGTMTSHAVTVTRAAKERVGPGVEVADLVRASFLFLLEREQKESILREFDIAVIGRYFPEFEAELPGRLGRSE